VDPDAGNIDPIMELDIDVHDFSIGQLEKDVTRGLETSKIMTQLRMKMYVSSSEI